MRRNFTDFDDIQIYASDAGTTNVTIGEWKTYRDSLETEITSGKRLCTYADLVCDYIKMSKEVMNVLGITELPNKAESAINDIVIIRGRECVPYAVASRPESLYVQLQGSGDIINFNFSGEIGDLPKIICEAEYDDSQSSTGKTSYNYNTIIEYEGTDLDTESDNLVKKLNITLNNFDIIPYVITNKETNYNVSAAEAQNIGILEFDEASSTQISNQRKLCFSIKTGVSRLFPNPKGDKKYLYNLYPILKIGGFSKNHTPEISSSIGTRIYPTEDR